MTGSWLAIVQGFAQMKTDHQQLKFAPFYQRHGQPTHSNYRNRLLFVEVAADQVAFTLLDGPAIPLTVYDQKYVKRSISFTDQKGSSCLKAFCLI